MKHLLPIIIALCILPGGISAQLHVAGGTLKISDGATLYSSGDVTNTSGGVFVNDGALITPGSIVNSNSATLSGNGLYSLHGNWINSADFAADFSTVSFGGAANSSVIAGGDAFFILEISKNNGKHLLAADDLAVDGELNFLQDNNQLELLENDFVFGATASYSGTDANNYIMTNGTGFVQRVELNTTPFTFPIGFNSTSYNPLTVVQDGGGDAIGVRCLEHALAGGVTGMALDHGVVDASWEVVEAVPGGSVLTLTAQWASADELTGFDRTDCGFAYHDGNNWSLPPDLSGTASSSDPYLFTRTGVTELGFFAVADGDLFVSAGEVSGGGWQFGELYPNPVGRSGTGVKLPLHSPATTDLQVQLLDNLGREISRMQTTTLPGGQVLELEIPMLAAGIYHLRIMAGGQLWHKGLVVQ